MPIRIPRPLAQVNKYIANPVMVLGARYVAPLAVVHHRGRKSGRAYRTPLLAFRHRDQIVLPLIYGETDWLRNVLAARGGSLERLGRTWTMTDPRVVTSANVSQLPRGTQWTAKAFGKSLVADLTQETS